MTADQAAVPREAPAIELRNVALSYGAVSALRDVSLRVGYGQVLGLIGDNGAGKSTLIKIISGLLRPSRGQLLIDGTRADFRSVAQARAAGISTVYQDLALIDTVSVYRNLFLGREETFGGPLALLRDRRMRKAAEEQFAEIGVNIPSVVASVGKLSGGQRQAIAVVRAIRAATKVLLLDEPLAAMGAKEGTMILDLISDLRGRGDMAIILIAHNYSHVLEVCDQVAVLQQGTIAFSKPTAETSLAELTKIMVDEYRATRGLVPGDGSSSGRG
jgi:simple sugar transport system ATP-binding protein